MVGCWSIQKHPLVMLYFTHMQKDMVEPMVVPRKWSRFMVYCAYLNCLLEPHDPMVFLLQVTSSMIFWGLKQHIRGSVSIMLLWHHDAMDNQHSCVVLWKICHHLYPVWSNSVKRYRLGTYIYIYMHRFRVIYLFFVPFVWQSTPKILKSLRMVDIRALMFLYGGFVRSMTDPFIGAIHW